jgi:hypothetical protein
MCRQVMFLFSKSRLTSNVRNWGWFHFFSLLPITPQYKCHDFLLNKRRLKPVYDKSMRITLFIHIFRTKKYKDQSKTTLLEIVIATPTNFDEGVVMSRRPDLTLTHINLKLVASRTQLTEPWWHTLNLCEN